MDAGLWNDRFIAKLHAEALQTGHRCITRLFAALKRGNLPEQNGGRLLLHRLSCSAA
ncbi:MAG TPA: hypothetical protein V6D34_06535 [Candidatus Sericytochromatia bacterium]